MASEKNKGVLIEKKLLLNIAVVFYDLFFGKHLENIMTKLKR
jgi:hypothetical protein